MIVQESKQALASTCISEVMVRSIVGGLVFTSSRLVNCIYLHHGKGRALIGGFSEFVHLVFILLCALLTIPEVDLEFELHRLNLGF